MRYLAEILDSLLVRSDSGRRRDAVVGVLPQDAECGKPVLIHRYAQGCERRNTVPTSSTDSPKQAAEQWLVSWKTATNDRRGAFDRGPNSRRVVGPRRIRVAKFVDGEEAKYGGNADAIIRSFSMWCNTYLNQTKLTILPAGTCPKRLSFASAVRPFSRQLALASREWQRR